MGVDSILSNPLKTSAASTDDTTMKQFEDLAPDDVGKLLEVILVTLQRFRPIDARDQEGYATALTLLGSALIETTPPEKPRIVR